MSLRTSSIHPTKSVSISFLSYVWLTFSAMLFLFQIVQTIVLMIFKDAVVEGDSPCAMREPQGDGQFAGLGNSNQPFASQNSDDL